MKEIEAQRISDGAKRIAVMSHILMVRRDFLHHILIWNSGCDYQRRRIRWLIMDKGTKITLMSDDE